MMKVNRVVVTGMGLASPLGCDVATFSQRLFAGQSGIDFIKRFDVSLMPTQIAGEVKEFPIEYAHRDKKVDFAVHACHQALSSAGIENAQLKELRSRISIGIGLELFSMSDLVRTRVEPELMLSEAERQTFLNTPSDYCLQHLQARHSFSQTPMLHISACAASTDAIGIAWKQIRRGEQDLIVAGGTDSMINPMGLAGFCRIGALSTENANPQKASRPFDRDRKGFVLGEGAGFLVLESASSAQKRGAQILAEISGYGNSLDAYSVSDPHPDGDGAVRAITKAIRSAQITSDEVSAISLHGTGTPKNDPVETKALHSVFQQKVYQIPAFASKSMLGHLISAGGAVETIAVVESIRQQRLHPTINLENVDYDCQLNHVLQGQQGIHLQHILKSSFGFGGMNSCLVVSAWSEEKS